MKINVKIERIENGYIVTNKGDKKSKRFYKTLEAFALGNIVEELMDRDRCIRQHSMPNKPFSFRLSTDL